MLNHNPDILYQLLNINYEIEQYIEINSPSNAKKDYLYAYYYPTYKELAYYNETAVYPIKIGYTTNNYPLLRIQEQLGTATPENPIIAYLIKIENAKKLEATIHNYLKMKNKHIDNTPNKEWFNTNTTELKEIIEMLTT